MRFRTAQDSGCVCGNRHFMSLVCQYLMKQINRDRTPEQPSLAKHGLRGSAEIIGLQFGLHPFHNYFKLKRLGHGKDLGKNAYGHGLRADRLGKRSVDLDRVDRELM